MGNDPSALLIAVLVVGMLALVLRWAFRPTRRPLGSYPVDAAASADLGLLTVVVAGLSRQQAMTRRATLGEAGIRSSMSRRRDGSFDVLVFHDDAPTARLLLER